MVLAGTLPYVSSRAAGRKFFGSPEALARRGGGTSAGDPVDPVTGRVYTAKVVDLALPGPIPLFIERSYSSERARRGAPADPAPGARGARRAISLRRPGPLRRDVVRATRQRRARPRAA
ncbi:DUF6531 domain-containing protein [Sorangium sp. So ce295]|uniref:DUF6531 domain-containing protein n=1 Tax=Sorangium sp. So ce295 TaxID=3133295 RepID=UPI003F5E698E